MRQAAGALERRTAGRGLVELTAEAARWSAAQGMTTGLLTLYLRHTSASLLIQENADPDVRRDLDAFFARLVPEDAGLYAHRAEGPDDMPAHIRAALTQSSLCVPLREGRLALGAWQGIFLWEHRARPQRREVLLHLVGE